MLAPALLLGVMQYCVTCHNDRNKTAGLTLTNFDASNVEVAEKVIRKLRARQMPPLGAPRPDAADVISYVESLEATIDSHATRAQNAPTFTRLNRAEYARAVRDLTGVEIDAAAYLPPDTSSGGFDNIADVQRFSPTLITGYLRAARAVAELAAARRPKQDVAQLTRQALRGNATDDDVADAQRFYKQGGLRLAIESILMNPRFLFRMQKSRASRIAFFLWGAAPDAALLRADPATLDPQVPRMLADPRSIALSTRFATQWLRLQETSRTSPDLLRETQMFFDSIVREDRSVMDLFTADYSFVNERVAALYGIPNVRGTNFRRVTLPDMRRGLFGQGSVLLSTSLADRTSPVLRGKWVLEVLLGTPPSPPPPIVPALDDSAPLVAGKSLSTRERIEQHRKNPGCNSCHRIIDPPGLALENFDATGAWRTRDNGVDVDASTQLVDGTKLTGAAGLRQLMLDRQDLVLRNFTENLLTYALGRRLDYRDMPAVRAIVNNASSHGNKMSAFIQGVVKELP